MIARRRLLALPVALLTALGASTCPSGGPGGSLIAQELLHVAGHPEPHTPGSGVAGLEMPASADVRSIVGPDPDLNRVSYLRTWLARPEPKAPRAVLILVPGFLGGAGTFAPLARELVAKFNGNLEVWAVDRRPNQLEDRRGAAHGLALLAAAGDEAEVQAALEAATFFYLPEQPGLDIDGDGVVDPPTELPDALGNPRSYVRLAQDDLRFAAHWGVDTYVRDWKVLVDAARELVGEDGLVLFGGHSQGTYWASVFAAYDFDPDPAVVDAGHRHIDGLVLLEGGGGRLPSGAVPSLASYEETVAALARPGGPDVYLESFQGIEPAVLGPSAELAGLAGLYRPLARSLIQRTVLFAAPPFSLLFNAPTTNRGIVGLFIDDDFQPLGLFRASVGFTSDGTNIYNGPSILGDAFYLALANGALRQWQDGDDPALPTCPPNAVDQSPGCAIVDNGPRPAPDQPPRVWGVEAEPTSLDELMRVQIGDANFIEWYFLSGRTGLDAAYGLDSSALVAESIAAHGHEGPLVVTRNANVDVPVLGIGGSNGLAPLESSFADYLASIATPAADQRVVILEGYAHLDPLTARDNAAVPVLTDWISELLVRKLLP